MSTTRIRRTRQASQVNSDMGVVDAVPKKTIVRQGQKIPVGGMTFIFAGTIDGKPVYGMNDNTVQEFEQRAFDTHQSQIPSVLKSVKLSDYPEDRSSSAGAMHRAHQRMKKVAKSDMDPVEKLRLIRECTEEYRKARLETQVTLQVGYLRNAQEKGLDLGEWS